MQNIKMTKNDEKRETHAKYKNNEKNCSDHKEKIYIKYKNKTKTRKKEKIQKIINKLKNRKK